MGIAKICNMVTSKILSRNHESCEKLTNNSFVTVEETDNTELFKLTWSGYQIHPEYDKITERFLEFRL